MRYSYQHVDINHKGLAYAQCYANLKDLCLNLTVLLEYIHFYVHHLQFTNSASFIPSTGMSSRNTVIL